MEWPIGVGYGFVTFAAASAGTSADNEADNIRLRDALLIEKSGRSELPGNPSIGRVCLPIVWCLNHKFFICASTVSPREESMIVGWVTSAGSACAGPNVDIRSLLERSFEPQYCKWLRRNERRDDGYRRGLECLMLESIYQANNGNIRLAWLTHRRIAGVVQSIGLHRRHYRSLLVKSLVSNFILALDPRFVWYRNLYTDPFLSLVLGLPTVSIDSSMVSKLAFGQDIPMGKLARHHCLAAGHILERNEQDPSADDFACTQSMDMELQKATSLTPSRSVSGILEYQRLTDRATIEQALENMEKGLPVGGNEPSNKGAKMLQLLLAIGSNPAISSGDSPANDNDTEADSSSLNGKIANETIGSERVVRDPSQSRDEGSSDTGEYFATLRGSGTTQHQGAKWAMTVGC
ncbi:C6 zinc finger domain-containing protein [Seiridium cupressi]